MDEKGPAQAATSRPTVTCKDVSHEYGGRSGTSSFGVLPWRSRGDQRTVVALRDVSLEVQSGDVISLAGPSGSGKSTLLHAMAGLIVPTQGTIELNETSLTDRSRRERARIRRDHVGFVFQRFHLLPSLSARANVAVPLVQFGLSKRERRKRASELLERVGLGDRETHQPGKLSGGEQQRVAIARALATDPAVVLADEPTGELDTETGCRVLEVLTDVAGGRTVVLASHDEHALAVTDRVVELRDGRVVDDGQ
ncbi:ABC transporter ATP-binding protein [Natronococcus occultus]|uniref:ABC-type antimicrobial peptide transport system, ATPase component n=1 Tax=Natronococcus occultus SP4 TaxID=694430 RepID=L0K3Z2_9EURY|nr:ABC transporter ATP-binding protein [Natronococcus occultus]AGB39270.1 ABC-type antimicrobial peptide transport system, ATPase component [Natronococcus occultus SP4]